ncbi:hypothetical protein MKW98_006234 [Papaver atlanticum]|uniref:F-box domain-containing protein n=1 Tax=Papaver atlanticum TaxID=357466 RepID=A0AAD4TDN7_9MAGN|nr:hypothetical protein MKW98_006234 [Papaver atlanticum]
MELCEGLMEKSEEDECQVVAVPEMQKLTSDAVYEILTRVTLVNLLRQCQWVCKDWQKLILCDARFQKKHLQNTLSLGPGCFVYDHPMKHIKFAPYVEGQPEHKSPKFSRIPSYYICEPATREWRKIPNPKASLASFNKIRIGIAVTQ